MKKQFDKDLNRTDENSINPKELINSVKRDIEEVSSFNTFEITQNSLNEIIKTAKPINFGELTGNKDVEKAKGSKIQVIVIDELVSISNSLKFNMCAQYDNFYLYNHYFWDKISEEKLQKFLGEFAEKIGLSENMAKYYKFKEHLVNQFRSTTIVVEKAKDRSKVLMNLKNGTLEITDNGYELREHRAEDFIKYVLPFSYDENARAPLFKRYLDDVIPEIDKQYLLAEYCASAFLPKDSGKIEKVLFLYGNGANGKSVFFDVFTALLGPDNITAFSLDELSKENGYNRIEIVDKLMNYASEIDTKFDFAMFKKLASGEKITVRSIYKAPFQTKDYARLMFNINELPEQVEQTHAFFRRLLIIPFEKEIPDEKQDNELDKKIIRSELAGVFNWIVEGLKRLQVNKGFTECDSSNRLIRRYKIDSDTVKLFLEESGYKPDVNNKISLMHLYGEFKEFCEKNGYRPLGKKKFKGRLIHCNFYDTKTNSGIEIYCKKSF
ncbi:phage/plasmid primase, P4 family [uncultured Marivirga sp.]|uniref:DNA primase family protein n=1 Tax=uncultured Marivirga sp. TaxID=1123707 RepID=UPI0030EF170B|tara:strand:+ start:4546 stop:6030 length:1485 start_codon:yes stop_codon:yes gene_type:complete